MRQRPKRCDRVHSGRDGSGKPQDDVASAILLSGERRGILRHGTDAAREWRHGHDSEHADPASLSTSVRCDMAVVNRIEGTGVGKAVRTVICAQRTFNAGRILHVGLESGEVPRPRSRTDRVPTCHGAEPLASAVLHAGKCGQATGVGQRLQQIVDQGRDEPMSDVAERVKKIVVEHLGVDEAKVTDNASFIDDLGADSLDTVELVMAFEEEFGCEIPDDVAEKIVTVKDAVGLHRGAFLIE